MISKRVISEIRALHLDKNRKEQQRFIAEGEKVVNELLHSGLKIYSVAGTKKYFEAHSMPGGDIESYEVSEEELLKISLLRTPNKVLAVGAIPQPAPVNFKTGEPLILALDGINDPGNLGTLIRTADWFGIRQLFCSPDCVDAYNPKVVQSAMGSLFRMQIYYSDLSEVIASARSEGAYRAIGAAIDGSPYESLEPSKNTLLVIGSESHGISKNINGILDYRVAIFKAKNSNAESLNAGVAGAILMAHFKKSGK